MSFSLNVLAVGNADCLVLEDGAITAVVDAPDLERLRAWLTVRDRRCIDCLFVTHNHADHFDGLQDFTEFATAWVDSGRTIGRICLPSGMFERAKAKLERTPKADRTSDAYCRLLTAMTWFSTRPRTTTRLDAGGFPFRLGGTTFSVLWPSTYAVETWNHGAQNPLSLVLRVEHGSFAAILLADLEGPGLRAVAVAAADPDPNARINVRANVVKVPHHGAWPANSADLRDLLELIDPECAILSVGSTNTYEHVRPELFTALLALRRPGRRFQGFVCTDLTRTCVQSAAERAAQGTAGLPKRQPCAGDIEIRVSAAGEWRMLRTDEHAKAVAAVARAACRGDADL